MTRLFWALFMIIASSCAGALVIAVLATPSLAEQAKMLIPLAALVGIILGGGVAFVIAKRIAAGVA